MDFNFALTKALLPLSYDFLIDEANTRIIENGYLSEEDKDSNQAKMVIASYEIPIQPYQLESLRFEVTGILTKKYLQSSAKEFVSCSNQGISQMNAYQEHVFYVIKDNDYNLALMPAAMFIKEEIANKL